MQAQAKRSAPAGEETALAFKRHILQESAGFAAAPQEDLFRVNLLSRMLDRFDALKEKGMSDFSASSRVIHEFSDIAALMREQGFEEIGANVQTPHASRWPELSEGDIAQYIEETDTCQHKRALGIGLCSACVLPLMIGGAFEEILNAEAATILGLMGMFAMIGLGVYAIVTAASPKKQKIVKEGRFSLSSRMRRKLMQLRESLESKARRRRGKGIAMLVTCIVPLLMGGLLDEAFFVDVWSYAGVAGMFAMIGAGVYEIVLAEGERKRLDPFFGEKE